MQLVVVDDHAFFRYSLCQMCEEEGDFIIAGESASAAEAMAAIAALRPDVVLMDIDMPVLDGITATRTLVAAPACPPIILLTTYYRSSERRRAGEAGARGYLAKDVSAATLFKAIHAVHRGHVWFQRPGAPT